MQLYSSQLGSNPKRVRMFLAEKDIKLPTTDLDLLKGEQDAPDYLAINSLAKAPALVLDDGTVITESVAICRFVEEHHPEPPMFGADAKSRAITEMWIRRAELELVRPCSDVVQHTVELFADKVDQNAEFAASQRELAGKKFAWLDKEIAGRDFLAGKAFSMADIIAITACDLAKMVKIEIPENLEHVQSWMARVMSRPSYSA